MTRDPNKQRRAAPAPPAPAYSYEGALSREKPLLPGAACCLPNKALALCKIASTPTLRAAFSYASSSFPVQSEIQSRAGRTLSALEGWTGCLQRRLWYVLSQVLLYTDTLLGTTFLLHRSLSRARAMMASEAFPDFPNFPKRNFEKLRFDRIGPGVMLFDQSYFLKSIVWPWWSQARKS